MSPRIGLALGGGGARGLAHILVLEALDEVGMKPAMIAGTSIGAMVGAAYASGLSAREIRAHTGAILRNRGDVLARLLPARVGRFTDLFGFSNPVLLDPERLVQRFMPDCLPEDFACLQIPLTIVATDYYGRSEYPISDGPLGSAIAASIAIPGLMRPVERNGRVLVDGGAVNPLPFDQVRPFSDLVIAVDVTGGPSADPMVDGPVIPGTSDLLFGSLQIMMNAIVDEKLKSARPDVLIRPRVGIFRALDFLKITAILKAAEPVKDKVKRAIEDVLAEAEAA